MRKVLSFVLALSLVLGSFSMAFAADPAPKADAAPTSLSDIAGIANEEAIQVNFDLGIVTGNTDGTYLPTKAVNRAEYAALITRALAIPDSALAGYTKTKFKDMNGYGWATKYIAFCESKGIMLGDGYGNVMPGRAVNTNEAMTMALRAIGYTANSSELVGVWPSNYVTLAQNNGLYEDVANAASVDKANAAQIIYNALSVQKVAVNTDGATKKLDNGKASTDADYVAYNLLNTGLKCTSEKMIVSYDETSLVNTTKYVGSHATVYKNSDKEIVAISPESTFLTGEFKAGSNYEKFKVDGVEYTVKNPTTVTVAAVKNAKVTDADKNSTLGAIVKDVTKTVTLAADVSGKTLTKVYSAATWTVTQNAQVEDSDIAQIAKNSKLLSKAFYKDNNNDIDKASFQLVGAKSLDAIKKDNIVYVYTLNNESGNKIVRVAVGTEVVEGMVQSYNKSDDAVKIAGKTYANAGVVAGNDLGDNEVSKDVKVRLDGYGDAYSFEVTKGQANNFAVVTGGNTTSGYDSIVKLFTADASNKTYTIDKDEVTGSTVAALGQIVGYSLDKNGVIDGFDNAITGTTKASMTIKDGLVVSNAKALKYGGSPSTSAIISNDVVVYTYAKGNVGSSDFGDVKVSSIAKIKTGENLIEAGNAATLYFDKDGKVVAMLVAASKASKSDTDLYAVLNGYDATVNADKDKVQALNGFANGTDLAGKLTDGTKTFANYSDHIQLYKLSTDANGVVTTAKLVGTKYNSNATPMAFTINSGVVVGDASKGYVKTSGAALGFADKEVIAIADKAVFYEVTLDGTNIDKYTLGSAPTKGDMVWVFDTNDDVDGYDVVIVLTK